MSEFAILNETVAWDDDIQDSPTPDYGFDNDRPSTRAVSKPAGGQPWSREVANTGHTFSLSWLNRSFKCVQRIRQFAEQYEDGYFTLIDHDGGGRHYVGRFTSIPKIQQLGNDRYTIQGLPFEEMPGVPMLEYPGDWDNDAVRLRPINDFGNQMLAVQGTWLRVGGVGTDGSNTLVMRNDGTASGAFATYEYRGYGCRLWMGVGPSYGTVLVYADGALVANLDLYAAQDQGVQMVLELARLPLDLHRIKVYVTATRNASSSASAVVWGFLDVMR